MSLRSFFALTMGAACIFVGSVCFGGIANENSSVFNVQVQPLMDLNDSDFSEVEAVTLGRGGGYQSSQNQLSFTFDASSQTNAFGTFKGIVTAPNQVSYSLNGIIGTAGYPVTLELGPPTLLGTYTMTFVITSNSGTIDPTQGPYGFAQNLTNGDQSQVTFNVQNTNSASATFLNRQ